MIHFYHIEAFLFGFSTDRNNTRQDTSSRFKSPLRKGMSDISIAGPNLSPTKHNHGTQIDHAKITPQFMLPLQLNYQAYPSPFARQQAPEHLPHLPAHQLTRHHFGAALEFEAPVLGFQPEAVESLALVPALVLS
jgi:hypothetical protein